MSIALFLTALRSLLKHHLLWQNLPPSLSILSLAAVDCYLNLLWTFVFQITKRNSCIIDSALRWLHDMDPETNYSITHLYTWIKILFSDIVTFTGLKTIFILILKNITFVKKSLEGLMTFADWIWKSSTMRCSLSGTMNVSFKDRQTWLQISGLQLASYVSIIKLFSLKPPETFFWFNPIDTFQFLCDWFTQSFDKDDFSFPQKLFSFYIFSCSLSATFADPSFLRLSDIYVPHESEWGPFFSSLSILSQGSHLLSG